MRKQHATSERIRVNSVQSSPKVKYSSYFDRLKFLKITVQFGQYAEILSLNTEEKLKQLLTLLETHLINKNGKKNLKRLNCAHIRLIQPRVHTLSSEI